MMWCNVSFLAWKSRAVCDGLIGFNRGEACAKTARATLTFLSCLATSRVRHNSMVHAEPFAIC